MHTSKNLLVQLIFPLNFSVLKINHEFYSRLHPALWIQREIKTQEANPTFSKSLNAKSKTRLLNRKKIDLQVF